MLTKSYRVCKYTLRPFPKEFFLSFFGGGARGEGEEGEPPSWFRNNPSLSKPFNLPAKLLSTIPYINIYTRYTFIFGDYIYVRLFSSFSMAGEYKLL